MQKKVVSSLRRYGALVTRAVNSDREWIGSNPSQVDSEIICYNDLLMLIVEQQSRLHLKDRLPTNLKDRHEITLGVKTDMYATI